MRMKKPVESVRHLFSDLNCSFPSRSVHFLDLLTLKSSKPRKTCEKVFYIIEQTIAFFSYLYLFISVVLRLEIFSVGLFNPQNSVMTLRQVVEVAAAVGVTFLPVFDIVYLVFCPLNRVELFWE